MKSRSLALCLVPIAFQLSGCVAVSGFPKQVFTEKQERAELAPYLKPSALVEYESCADKVACRNAIIDARVRAVDLSFFRFIRKVYSQEGAVSVGSDILAIALDSAETVTGVKGLAAGAGAITASRDAYEKQVATSAMPALFMQMLSRRREVLLRIKQGEALPISSYSILEALGDISEYELAGSIPGAAADLGTTAGTQARAAQARLDSFRANAAPPPSVASASVSAPPAGVTVTTPPPPPGVTVTTPPPPPPRP